jgi:hypothetical protein
MLRKLAVALLALVTVVTISVPQEAMAGGGGEYRVRARMRTGTAFEGKSDYRERLRGTTLVQTFNVEVNGAQPGEMFEIHINGVLFGTMITNDLGSAELEFRTATVDDNPQDEEPPLPTDFPRINDGDVITVGALRGTYRLR